jgi:hypothetical protein
MATGGGGAGDGGNNGGYLTAAGGGGGGAFILAASGGVTFTGLGDEGSGTGSIFGSFTNSGSFPDGDPGTNSYSSWDGMSAGDYFLSAGAGGGGVGGDGQIVPNQPPSGADNTLRAVFGAASTPVVLTAANFGFSDQDGNSFLAVEITTLPALGILKYDGAAATAGQFITVSDIEAGKLIFDASNVWNQRDGWTIFTFQVQDNGGTANGGVDLDPFAKSMAFNFYES